MTLLWSKIPKPIAQGGLLALAIALPLTVAPPAQAGFLDTVRQILRGDTGGRATGRARGGAIRDGFCGARDSGEPSELSEPSEPAEVNPEGNSLPLGLIPLVPETPQKTLQATPEFFLYVPSDQSNENLALEFELQIKDADGDHQGVAEPLLLPLPAQPGLVRFQLPETTPLAVGKTYVWNFRLVCNSTPIAGGETAAPLIGSADATGTVDAGQIQIFDLGSEAETADAQGLTEGSTIQQEVYGDIQRIAQPAGLATAIASSDLDNRYQAYLAYDIWFEMVSDLASSSEWTEFLAEFELDNVDPTPQTLTPNHD